MPDTSFLDEWPKCAIPACQNKSCLRLESIYCWPHTPGENQPEVERSLALEKHELARGGVIGIGPWGN